MRSHPLSEVFYKKIIKQKRKKCKKIIRTHILMIFLMILLFFITSRAMKKAVRIRFLTAST